MSLFAVSACAKDKGPTAPLDLTTTQQLSAGDVDQLTLTRVDSVTLGSAGQSVDEIADFAVRGDTFYVLDGMAKHVRVFDRSGRLLSTIGRPGSGPGEFKSPMALALNGSGLLVADLTQGKYLAVFNEQGAFVENRPVHTAMPPISVASSGSLVASLGILSIADPEKQGWNVVGITNTKGDSLGTGCVIDPRFVASRKRDGRIAHMDFGAVTVRGDSVYCTQVISPVVQVMDRTGHPVRQIRVAPPFYKAPEDAELSTNQKAIFDFLGTFTAHAKHIPLDDGFVSMYTRFNTELGEIRYNLLVCRQESELRCGTVENIRHPVYIPSLDTVYIEEEADANRPTRIGIYHLAKQGG